MIASALVMLCGCGPSKEQIQATLDAKAALLRNDELARFYTHQTESLLDVCSPRPELHETHESKRVVKCLAAATGMNEQLEKYLGYRSGSERAYVEACRACAPAADCEQDRLAMERPLTQTSKEWTPCIR